MTDEERVIITAYTGYSMLKGEKLNLFYEYIEKLLKRPVFTHELGSNEIWNEIHEKSKKDFINLCG